MTEQQTEAPTVNRYAIPSMGSADDAWDSVIVLPKGEEPQPRDDRRRRHRKRTRPDEIVFLEWDPQLPWATILGAIAVLLGFLSTGPAMPMMGIWGGVAVLMAAVALWQSWLGTEPPQGRVTALVIILLGAVLILTQTFVPSHPAFYRVYMAGARASRSGSAEERYELALRRMTRVAEAANLAWISDGNQAAAIGRNSLNGVLDPQSVSFPISTLIPPPEGDLAFEGFFAYDETTIPKDPYSDDPRATFGVYFTKRHILVFSPGPDGVFQMNPRLPVEEDCVDPIAELAPFLYPPAGQGANVPGDLLLVFELESIDENFYLQPGDIERRLEDENKGVDSDPEPILTPFRGAGDSDAPPPRPMGAVP